MGPRRECGSGVGVRGCGTRPYMRIDAMHTTTPNPRTHLSRPESAPAWTQAGVAVGDTDSLDEMLEKAGLNWQVAKVPLVTDDGLHTRVPRAYAIRRTDRPSEPDGILGVVG